MKSARGQETSYISMIKVRGSGREREGTGGSGREREGAAGRERGREGARESGREREGARGSEREVKQEKLLKQKVVLDTHSFWNRTLYCGPTG